MEKYRLREFHKFSFNRQIYLYNVNRIQGYRINEALAKEIDKLKNTLEFTLEELGPELVTALRKLHLVEKISVEKKVDFNPPERVPVSSISLNVAQLCNLSCIYCYGVDGEYGEKGLMKEEIAYAAVDWLIEQSMGLSEVHINFFGGEPLLNFSLIKKVVEYAKQRCKERNKKIRFSMVTNGTLLKDEINQFLNDHDFSITLSFDGDANVQDKNRPLKGGRGSYKIARKRVKEFLKSRDGRKTTGKATITGFNVNLNQIRDALVEIGFKHVKTTVVTLPESSVFPNSNGNGKLPVRNGCGTNGMSTDNGSTTFKNTSAPVQLKGELAKTAKILKLDEAHLNSAQYKFLQKDLEQLAQDTLRRIKNREHVYDRTILELIGMLHKRSPKLYFCSAGTRYFTISISGDVYPCHRMVGQKDKVLGNINRWDPSVQKPYIENYGMSHPKCKNCFARFQCGGGCFHESLETNGSMAEPNNNYCKYMRRSLELAIAIKDQLNIFDKTHLGLVNKPHKKLKKSDKPSVKKETVAV